MSVIRSSNPSSRIRGASPLGLPNSVARSPLRRSLPPPPKATARPRRSGFAAKAGRSAGSLAMLARSRTPAKSILGGISLMSGFRLHLANGVVNEAFVVGRRDVAAQDLRRDRHRQIHGLAPDG